MGSTGTRLTLEARWTLRLSTGLSISIGLSVGRIDVRLAGLPQIQLFVMHTYAVGQASWQMWPLDQAVTR